MLQLEALQANDGDCLLLRYGADSKPSVILIDGGSAGVYRDVLSKRLDQLRGRSPALNLRLVVVSHIDADHITGLLDMFKQMSESVNDRVEPRWTVTSLWHNGFEKVVGSHPPSAATATVAAAAAGAANLQDLIEGLNDEKAVAVVASVKQGKDLQNLAKTTATKINAETKGKLIVARETGRTDIPIDMSLKFTILGPRETQLLKLEKEWNKSKAKHPVNESAAAADYLNRTIPNLSSIVFIAEYTNETAQTTRMLFTGDAGGDLILEGLETAALLDSNGRIRLDILKIQHHGSNHSADIGFFQRVIADRYVISGNGKHGIPHMDTLSWLSNARRDEACRIYMTNRNMVDGDVDFTDKLDAFLAHEATDQPMHEYRFRRDADLSIVIS
jgi:beta-lactamase superfamily II metal-dependent hydrolase